MDLQIRNARGIGRAIAVALVPCLSTVAIAGDLWVVRPQGTGPVRIGMSLIELNHTLHSSFTTPTDEDEKGCFDVSPPNHPGISLMVLKGHVERIDAFEPNVTTETGIRIGSTEEQVIHAYGNSLRIEPSFYDEPDGHYLTYIPTGRYGIRFETSHGEVIRFYAGSVEAISLVEGCL